MNRQIEEVRQGLVDSAIAVAELTEQISHVVSESLRIAGLEDDAVAEGMRPGSALLSFLHSAAAKAARAAGRAGLASVLFQHPDLINLVKVLFEMNVRCQQIIAQIYSAADHLAKQDAHGDQVTMRQLADMVKSTFVGFQQDVGSAFGKLSNAEKTLAEQISGSRPEVLVSQSPTRKNRVLVSVSSKRNNKSVETSARVGDILLGFSRDFEVKADVRLVEGYGEDASARSKCLMDVMKDLGLEHTVLKVVGRNKVGNAAWYQAPTLLGRVRDDRHAADEKTVEDIADALFDDAEETSI
ncbi:MAG: hypothetical protein M5U25_13230 [Planctomycetota bacterium]|nr:hypothetical protein [Planctomycetota bacterium]